MIHKRKKQWGRAFGTQTRHTDAGLNTIMVGIVKSNDDPQKMGRIRVWIPELGGDATDEGNWWICSYASPFAGVTSPTELVRDGRTMNDSSRSYGWWAMQPDLENQVLVAFANGDPSKGFWFACLYAQNMNHMVPGIPANVTTNPDGTTETLPPVVEYNRWSNVNTEDPARPTYSPLHDGLTQQGLGSDPERGPSSGGARREAPSKVVGFLTPGGNQVYSDDNPNNGYIRIRTTGGAQVLVHDTSGYVYINSKEGNSWIEVSDAGVDIYSKGSISMRAEEDLNLHADRDVFIHAGNSLIAHAGNTVGIESGGNTEVKVGASLVQSAGGNASLLAGGDIGHSAGGKIAADAGGSISALSGGDNIRSAATLQDNTGVTAPGSGAVAAGSRPVGSRGGISTITNRTPTHEPWPYHPGAKRWQSVEEGGTGGMAQTGSGTEVEVTTTAPDVGGDTVAINASDEDWLAILIWSEARGESDEGKAAVAQALKNRLAMNWRIGRNGSPFTGIKSHILARSQFSYFWSSNGRTLDGNSFQKAEQIGQRAMRENQNTAVYQKCKEIGRAVMAGTYQGGAAFNRIKSDIRYVFFATANLRPSWLSDTRSGSATRIGFHIFYAYKR